MNPPRPESDNEPELVDMIDAMLDDMVRQKKPHGVHYLEGEALVPEGIVPIHVMASSDPRWMERVRRLHVDMYGCDFEEWEPQ